MYINWATSWENLSLGDLWITQTQTSLRISAFVIRFVESIICNLLQVKWKFSSQSVWLRRLVWNSLFRKQTGFLARRPNLSLCLLGDFSCFFCRLLKFFKINSFEVPFWNTIRLSNSLDPDQVWQSLRPDLDPKCLQRLSADDTSRQKVDNIFFW